jgi:DNA-binding transcriptional MerR regulator
MPSRLRVQKRLYYKIGEACKLLDVQPYVLRYWETEFPALSPAKSRSGQRVYNEKELAVIRRIKELLYDEGYTIAGAKKKLEGELAAGMVGKLAVVEEGEGADYAVVEAAPAEEGAAEAEEPPGEDEPPVPSAAEADPALAAAAGAAIEESAPAAPESAEKPAARQLRLRPERRRERQAELPAPLDTGGERVEKFRAGVERALREAREILALLDSKPPIK